MKKHLALQRQQNKDGTPLTGNDCVLPVAVKTCKIEADLITAEKFLQEACELLFKVSIVLTVFIVSFYYNKIKYQQIL